MLGPLLAAMALLGHSTPEALVPPPQDGVSRYLGFQIFSATAKAEIAFAAGFPPLTYPPKENVAAMVDSIVAAIGTTGNKNTKLAFILGPLAFDHRDDDVRTMIHYGFAIAREKNIAVGFHIDDAMFWSKRTDLAANPDNIEWISFDPEVSRGLLLDWGGGPAAFPPRLCMSSPALLAEVTRRARDVMGAAIKQEIDALHAAGKDELYAGVIVGWESHMGHDAPTDRPLGFHALSNAGYGPGHPPASFGAENARTVKRYIERWAHGLAAAGVPRDMIYSHINFIPRGVFQALKQTDPALSGVSYGDIVNTAPSSIEPEVAFGKGLQPGFTMYPTTGTLEAVWRKLAEHGNPHWASSEGTNLVPGADLASVKDSLETYLAQRFNHGATLVNIFSWGICGDAMKGSNPFRNVTEREEALVAYRKFLASGN